VADCYSEAVRIFGREKAREVWHITDENHDRMVEAVAGTAVGHRRLGSATFASGEEERARLEESAQLLRDDGFQALWDGTRLVNPRDGEINPALMVGALAGRLKEGAIREGVEVTGVVRAGAEVSVRSGESECRAGVVILATNGYTSRLLPQVKIQPTRAQMLASAPVSKTIVDMPTYSHFGYRYWRQLVSGELLIGGWRETSMESEVGYDDKPTDQIQEHLDGKLEEMSPGAEVTNRWAGIMGFTETGLPLAGPVEGMRNVYTCAGFNGHGMGFAFMTAKALVEKI
jgi:gamma-glutamylputrescine oxidase